MVLKIQSFEKAMECFIGIIFLIVIIGTTTMAKSYSDTDLTSDITSTGYDQYPWSVLPPLRGPTVQDKLEWKWTANDRSEKGPIDKFLQSPWKKSSILPAKHNSRSVSSNKKIEDKGPGSMEIYRLANIDETELNLITEWNNSELRKKMKNKLPKKSHYMKNHHKIQSEKSNLSTNKRQMTNKIIKIDELNDSRGVPELQIGCEGLEAPIEPLIREQRSISMNNDTTKDDYIHIETLVPPVNPVTIDWHYDDTNNDNKNYEEMDELLKLKKLENKKRIKQRSDIPPDEDIIDYDYKKIPTRGDLVSRKVRSIFDKAEETRGIRRNKQDPWGFGEDDGYISGNNDDDDDDDSDNSAQRIEADRRRQNYDRMQREETERRRMLMIERQRERQREEEMRRANDELSQIDRIREEYESRQSAEQREQERKLKDYIERNRPIVVEDRDDRNRRIQEEFRRRAEATRNNVPVRTEDHSRGPAPPVNPSVSYDDLRRRQEAELLRRQEEYLRRREEEKRVADARRVEERSRAGENQTRDYPNRRLEDERRNEEEYLRRREEEARLRARGNQANDSENRRREEERRRQEEERLRERQNQNNLNRRIEEERRRQEEERLRERQNPSNSNRRLEEERRREEETRRIQAQRYEEDRQNRLMEQKKKELGVISFDQAQRRVWEEKRLNSLPVSARILLIPNSLTPPRSTTSSPLFGSRGNFDNDVDLPAINPNRPGLSASRFPAAPTPKPPSISPGSCVWAVVQCCPNSDQRRLSNCFEHMGCPGVNWDSSPCRDSISNAARAEVVRYYASYDEP